MASIRSIRSLACMSLALVMLAIPRRSFAQVLIVSTIEPPALPVYDQPPCPGAGYIWTPGYWAWNTNDYYWVPGTWALAPQLGFLWTPGYWGWADGSYLWHEGWWGSHVGFYGGVAYGYGYGGVGYDGGYWNGGHFFYNTTVNRVDVTVIRNTYSKTVVNTTTRVSYNGGQRGLAARPTREEEAFAREKHAGPTAYQSHHVQAARANPGQRFAANHGAPPVATASSREALADRGVARARPGVGKGAAETKGARAPHAAPRAGAPAAQKPQPGAHPQQKGAPHPASKAPAEKKAPPPPAPAKEKPHKPHS